MTRTNKQYSYKHFEHEKYQSRIKQTRAYILNNNLSGLLNNHKWQEIFEYLKFNHVPFTLTTLLNSTEKTCTFIRELENNCILIDDSGQFIDFFEIKTLKTSKHDSLKTFLDKLNIEYIDSDTDVEIICYR